MFDNNIKDVNNCVIDENKICDNKNEINNNKFNSSLIIPIIVIIIFVFFFFNSKN